MFLKNEKDAQNQAPLSAPPRPAPRSLSTQNSIPMTNGSTKNDETAQVGYEFPSHFSFSLACKYFPCFRSPPLKFIM